MKVLREVPLCLVLAVLLAWLGPAVWGGRTLFYRDLHHQYIGTARLLAGEAGVGRRLLWDPLLNGGQPLLGNPNRAVLYPTRVVYKLTGAVTGMNLEILIHLLLGAGGAYLLTRRLKLGPWAAAVAAAAWSLGGLSASLTNHLGRGFAFHWTPWAVAAALWAAEGGRRRRWVLVSLVLAVQLLSGGLEMAGVSWLTAALWVGWRRRGRRPVRALGAFLAASAVGVCLAAVQVVPAAAMVARSGRAALDVATKLTWSVHPLRLPEILVPGWMGPVDIAALAGRYWGEHLVDHGVGYFLSIYLGASVVVLAAAGYGAARRRNQARLLAALAVAGVVFSLGRHLPGLTFLVTVAGRFLPLRFPVKALTLAALPVAVLAAMGAEAVRRRGMDARWFAAATAVPALPWLGMVLAPGAASRVLGFLFQQPHGVPPEGPENALAHAALSLAVLALAVTVGRRGSRLTGPILLAVVVGDLLSAAVPAVPQAPRRLLEQRPPALRSVDALLRGGRLVRAPDPVPLPMRVAADRAWASTEVDLLRLDGYIATAYGVPMIYHRDDPVLAGRRMDALTERVRQVPLERTEPLLKLGAVGAVLRDRLPEVPWLGPAVRIPTPSPVPLFLAPLRPAPKGAWFVKRAVRVANRESALQHVVADGFDPLAEVVVEPVRPGLPIPGPEEVVGRWTVHAPAAGWAVLSVPWVPGMEVWEGPRRLAVHPADEAFTAVELGPGDHSLTVRYRPPEVAAGVAVTLLTVAVLAVLWGWSWRRDRR